MVSYFFRFLHILDLWSWVWSILIGLERQWSDQLRSKPHNESYFLQCRGVGGYMGPVVVNVAGVVSLPCRHGRDTALAILFLNITTAFCNNGPALNCLYKYNCTNRMIALSTSDTSLQLEVAAVHCTCTNQSFHYIWIYCHLFTFLVTTF